MAKAPKAKMPAKFSQALVPATKARNSPEAKAPKVATRMINRRSSLSE